MRTSSRHGWLLVACGLLVAACTGQDVIPETLGPDPLSAQPSFGEPVLDPELVPIVRTTASYHSAGESRRLTDVRSVTVSVEVENVRGPKTISAEFTAPNGRPYELQSQKLFGRESDLQRFDFKLPVAGTTIDSASMAGEWTVKLKLQNRPLAEHRFGLEP